MLVLGLLCLTLVTGLELAINVNKKMQNLGKSFGVEGDANREKRDSSHRQVSNKVSALLNAASYLDDQIVKLEDSLVETVEAARAAMAAATEESNALQVSYGLSIVAANAFYTENVIWEKPVETFVPTDWGTIGSSLGYAWGYGAPYLVGGQLGSPDPGCGADDLLAAMDSSYIPPLQAVYQSLAADTATNPNLLLQPHHQPALVRQAVLERGRAMRSAISCLAGQGEVTTVLDNMKAAYLVRLEITQAIIDCLVAEI